MSGGGREEGTSTMTTGFAAGRGKGPFLSLSSLFLVLDCLESWKEEGVALSGALPERGRKRPAEEGFTKKSQSPSHKILSFVPRDEIIYLVD